MALKQWIKSANDRALDMADEYAKTVWYKVLTLAATGGVATVAGFWVGRGGHPIAMWIALTCAVVCVVSNAITFHYREKSMYWRGVRNGWETAPLVIHHDAPKEKK